MHVRELGEFGLIDRIKAILGEGGSGVSRGIGDDTAVLEPTAGLRLLATCDVQIDGVHFIADQAPPADVGHRALAVNLSDIAAMGGRPRWALVSLGLAPATSVGYVEELYRGMKALADRHGVAVVGGNIARAGGAIFVDVTVLGEVAADRIGARDGAQPGDIVAVTGTLGDAAAGLRIILEGEKGIDARTRAQLMGRHRRPEPRIALGQALVASGAVTALMDISDGLAQDLGHICRASGVGARIEESRLPLSSALLAYASQTGFHPTTAALSGGEDYELLATIRPDRYADAAAAVVAAGGPPLQRVGEIVVTGMTLVRADGRAVPLEAAGHDHLKSAPRGGRSRPESERPTRTEGAPRNAPSAKRKR